MLPLFALPILGFFKAKLLGAGASVASTALGAVGGSKTKLIAILLVVAGIAFGFWFIKNKIENLKEQVATLQQELGGYKVTVAAFEISIAKQNDAVKKLQEEGKLLENKAKLKQREAREITKTYENEIRRLLSEKTEIKTCDDGISYLKDKAIGELKW